MVTHETSDFILLGKFPSFRRIRVREKLKTLQFIR